MKMLITIEVEGRDGLEHQRLDDEHAIRMLLEFDQQPVRAEQLICERDLANKVNTAILQLTAFFDAERR